MFWGEGPRTAPKSPLERGGPLAVGSVLFSKDGFIIWNEEGSSQRSACSVFWQASLSPRSETGRTQCDWPPEVTDCD
ncbi:hypothetical protein Y697_08410 [Mesotoga sp. BH458_6_3_2_1]|nr:hypothetical protein Y697_08410 [Mesotoga sp. BH458_6_3_2_1]